MEQKKATWNDIEHALNSGTLEQLDHTTLEAFSRVEPPPSGNPSFHLRFNDAKRRIDRMLNKYEASLQRGEDARGTKSLEQSYAQNVAILDDVENSLVFSDATRKKHGLPSVADLNSLPANFRQALIFRCALRVMPALATRRGKPRLWDQAAIREHTESLVRAVQAALINCTNNTSRRPKQISATWLAEREAKRARRASRSDDFHSKAAMGLIALAANGGTLKKADLVMDILVKQQFFYHGLAEAIGWDFQQLKQEAKGNGQWPAPEFFRKLLWPADAPQGWVSDLEDWNNDLNSVDLAWAPLAYNDWRNGKFDVDVSLHELEEWASRVSADDGNDSASPELDDDDEFLVKQDVNLGLRVVESHFGNDTIPAEDTLSRRKLAQVLAVFLRDKRTRTPLTLSIEGPWGTGKTTFMRLLQEQLQTAESDSRRIRTIWFNPWRHQTHEELWAAFALQITEGIAKNIRLKDRLGKWRQLHWRLFNWKDGWSDLFAFILRFSLWFGSVIIGVGFFRFGLAEAKDKDWLLAAVLSAGGLLTFVGAIAAAIKSVSEVVESPFSIDLKRHLTKPNYREKASFLAQFQTHFRDFCEIYVPKTDTYVIFIDDLDRCDLSRAAELMQAINLMLSDDAPFIYVLGMDRAKVAAGIAVKSSELLPFLYARELSMVDHDAQDDALRTRGLEHGYEYIEKFIQLPFRLPPSDSEEVRGFIRGRLTLPPKQDDPAPLTEVVRNKADAVPALSYSKPIETTPNGFSPSVPGLPSNEVPVKFVPDESHLEEPLLFASRVLAGNPRRIAHLINLVRLQRLLAPVLGITVANGQLAKWTAIALRWPVFVLDLTQEPALLAQLILRDDPASPSRRFVFWRGNSEFLNFLRSIGPSGDDSDEYRLSSPEVIEALLRLGITVPLIDDSKAIARAIATKLK